MFSSFPNYLVVYQIVCAQPLLTSQGAPTGSCSCGVAITLDSWEQVGVPSKDNNHLRKIMQRLSRCGLLLAACHLKISVRPQGTGERLLPPVAVSKLICNELVLSFTLHGRLRSGPKI